MRARSPVPRPAWWTTTLVAVLATTGSTGTAAVVAPGVAAVNAADANGAAGDDGAAATDVERLLAEIGEAQRGVTTFRARFEQEKRLEIVRDVLRSSGTILVSRDRGVVWEIESPEPARMAVLGDGIFVDGRALGEMPGGGGPLPAGRLGALFAGVSPALLEDFEVEPAAGETLRLKPRHAALSAVVREITLVLDGPHRLPARITLDEDGGATTVIQLDRFELDPEISGEAFSP